VFILFLFLFLSCQKNEKQKIIQLVNEWQGKEILFPDEIIFTRFVTDTVDFELGNTEYKILVYVDSIGCTSCKLQLDKWKDFIAEIDTIKDSSVPILFFLQSPNTNEIKQILKRERFDYPVCIDIADKLNRLNHFSPQAGFQTFLLDKNNKILIIGNPVYNPAIKNLYLNQISIV
ncbi:MAG: hypothetical protein LUE98_02455, partial [Tannerellaceae bacterium]|nr:hypothetical protein [Tannerellaceae bacterium]